MLGSARTHFGCGKEGQAGAQEKKEIPRGSLQTGPGGTFPSWGQGISATPLEPATFPQVFGILLLGRSKRHTLVPLGTKESKHTGTGAKAVAKRAREAVSVMAVVGENNDPNRDPVTKGQVSRPGPSSLPTLLLLLCFPSVLLFSLPLKVKVSQLCPTVFDPMDCSLQGSSVLHYLL